MLLVAVFHHIPVVFWLWGWNLGHRPVLATEFDSAPVHPPPPVASLGPLGGKDEVRAINKEDLTLV
jgi:hypothetical protein